MAFFFGLLISGMVAGAIYSMFASGLTLVYATTGIYNFAFGAMAFIAGLVYYQLSAGLGLPRYGAFAVTVLLLAPLTALVFERLVFRPLARAPERNRLLGSVGLVVGLPALGYLAVDVLRNNLHVHLVDLSGSYLVAGVGPEPPKVYRLFSGGSVNSDQLIALLGTCVAVGGLWLLVTKTTVGLHTRAVVDRSELASLRGVNPASTSRVAWILATILAALAGVLASPIFGLSPDTGLQFVVGSSAVFVIARFRSLPIAMVGGLLLGALSGVIAGYGSKVPGLKQALVAVPGLGSSVIYIALLAGLLWRGRERVRVAGATVSSEPVPGDYLSDIPPWRRAWPWVGLTAALLLWTLRTLPWGHIQAGGLEQSMVITGLAMSLVFLSFCVVVGMLGVVSLAQAAFVTAGGLTAGLVVHTGFLGGGFFAAVLAGALASTILALVTALPGLRIGGIALALATLALAFMGDEILFQVKPLNNDGTGWRLAPPVFGPVDLRQRPQFVVFLLVILLLAIWAVRNVQKSVTGRAIMAVRFAPAAASAIGTSSRNAILTAFGLTGFLAGLGGVFLAYANGTAIATNYTTATGLLWVTIAVLWGVRRPGGAILAGLSGALFSRILQTGFWGITPRITNPTVPILLFGLSCIALANQPDGFLADMSRRRFLGRQRRRTKAHGGPGAAPLPETSSSTPFTSAITPGDRSGRPVSDIGPLPALELHSVSGGYVDAEVLHEVSLTVPQGSIVAVLGPNGAGKSTLCGLIAGTVAQHGGHILLGGREVTELRADRRFAAGLVLVPEVRGIFPSLTVEENLAISLPRREDREKVFERYGQLAARRRLVARSLSGGEQQMLALAPVLLEPPQVLIVDELSLGLAPAVFAEMISVLRELRARGVSILMVEEKARNVLELADYCAFLVQGGISAFGPMSEFSHDVAAESYLGHGDGSAALNPLTLPTANPDRPGEPVPSVTTATPKQETGDIG